jgi:hypothetical protein
MIVGIFAQVFRWGTKKFISGGAGTDHSSGDGAIYCISLNGMSKTSE